MGQKVNPTGIRLGITTTWTSKWYAEGREYADFLEADLKARQFVEKELHAAGVSRIEIERTLHRARVTIHCARPGVAIGKKGDAIDQLRDKIGKILGATTHLNIEEIRRPELDAKLVAQSVAQQLEGRIMFRRAMKRAVQSALKLGAKGVKICVSGRLGGAEIARTEWYREGRVPLHTFRANIDYGIARANTTYGVIGVKVWIFKEETPVKKSQEQQNTAVA